MAAQIGRNVTNHMAEDGSDRFRASREGAAAQAASPPAGSTADGLSIGPDFCDAGQFVSLYVSARIPSAPVRRNPEQPDSLTR